ncbi:membrane protein [Fervidicella metallireducens AeB]|uniref:Membrane protein n=1 Tax=Fervidicella metallireducens AeB TaxID=1403537 RepID=A0A017RSW8_9CLOT|nr:DMT family transporter [Fervidicella metallireducens]EYE87757.1 membrane protein [Fervidicella metallireducens AeB]
MDNKRKAIILILLSSFSFAMMQTMVKLAGNLPTFEKVFVRNLISLFIAFSIIYKNKASVFGKKENQKYLLLRSILGLLGVIFYFYSINHLIMADAAMLNKLSPFFVVIFAWIFLKEKLTKRNIISLFIVIIGAMLVIKPKFSLEIIPAAAGFFAAVCAGAAYTLVRFLGNRENPSTIVFYFSLVSVIGVFPLMLLDFVFPTKMQFLYLLGIGIFAALGQFSLTFAYKYGKAAEVAIFDYTNIIFAAILGFTLWGEIPDMYSFIGGILILGTALFNYLYNSKSA